MFNREPVMMPGPDGTPMPQKAAERAWEIHNDKQAEFAQLAVQERRRGVQTRDADTAREQAKKTHEEKTGRAAARWRKIQSGFQALANRLRQDLPLAATLFTVAVSLIVTLSGQWMFYGALPWPLGFAWLVVPMALLVESGSWTYGIQARWLADNEQPYGAKTRRMWLLALLAAGMNTYHGATAFPGHLEMGFILGGGSVLGPGAWHGYIYLTKVRARARHRSGAEIRAAVGRRLHHPILTWRAHDLRSMLGGRITPERAFLMVFRERYGYLPGQRPALSQQWRRVSTVQVRWSPGAAVTAELSAQPGAETGTQLSAGVSAEPLPPVVVSGADDRPSTPPVLALVGGDGSADEESVIDEIETYLRGLTVDDVERPGSALKTGETSTSDVLSGPPVQRSTDRPVSAQPGAGSALHPGAEDGVVQRSGQAGVERSRPVGSRQKRARARQTKAGQVRAHVDQLVAAGTDLGSINASEVAAALKIPQSTARNELAKIRNETADRHQA